MANSMIPNYYEEALLNLLEKKCIIGGMTVPISKTGYDVPCGIYGLTKLYGLPGCKSKKHNKSKKRK